MQRQISCFISSTCHHKGGNGEKKVKPKRSELAKSQLVYVSVCVCVCVCVWGMKFDLDQSRKEAKKYTKCRVRCPVVRGRGRRDY